MKRLRGVSVGMMIPPKRASGRLATFIFAAAIASLTVGAALALAASPSITIGPATAITHTTAHFEGSINTEGQEGLYAFEYTTEPAGPWSSGPEEYLEAGLGTVPVSYNATGLRAGAEYSVRLRYFNFTETFFSSEPNPTFTTPGVPAPVVTIVGPTEVTADSARFSGEINPEGTEAASDVDWEFQCSPECPGLVGGHIPADTANHPVELVAHNLAPNTTYAVSLIATNAGGPTSAGPKSFLTDASAPQITTLEPIDQSTTGVTLRGTVNPFGLQSTYSFEYGTTTAYGFRAPADHAAVAGNGRSPIYVAQTIGALAPGATYHYRLIADNAAGSAASVDQTFTTVPSSAPTRAYEQVSPVDKGGSELDIEATDNYQASPDGNRLVFTSKTALGGSVEPESAPLLSKYATARSDNGWSSPRPLDPPVGIGSANPSILNTLAVSEDGTEAMVISLKSLAPGAVEGESNLYLRNTTTGALTTIGTSPGTIFYKQVHFSPANAPTFIGGSSDFSHLVFSDVLDPPFLPGVPPGTLYEWSAGELRPLSIEPNGAPFPSASETPGPRHARFVSTNGQMTYFANEGMIYLRENGTVTRPVAPGAVGGISSDGETLFYADGAGLERYDAKTAQSQFIAAGVQLEQIHEVSADGSYVYFQSSEVLAGAATAGGSNQYVWHSGEISFIATLDSALDTGGLTNYIASESGRYFAFSVFTRLASYDNSSTACQNFRVGEPGTACAEVYRFDTLSKTLFCVSCRPDGGEPTGSAHIGFLEPAVFGRYYPRAVADNGEVFFDTPDSLSANDTNSARDVYSFDGERTRLISAGRGPGDSVFSDASADGKNVFFTTSDRLVAQDTDELVDVYDARVGGGIAAQSIAPTVSAQCAGEACRGPAPPPPSALFGGGSEATFGSGNLAHKHQKHCGKRRHLTKLKGGKTRCAVRHPNHHKRGTSK